MENDDLVELAPGEDVGLKYRHVTAKQRYGKKLVLTEGGVTSFKPTRVKNVDFEVEIRYFSHIEIIPFIGGGPNLGAREFES
jgi:hypothetical protein